MNGQLSFAASVRTTDPRTSKDAAASMRGRPLSAQRGRVFDEVQKRPVWGVTAYEIAGITGYQQSVVARRLTDLRDMGMIADTGDTRPGSTGRQLIVWRAAW